MMTEEMIARLRRSLTVHEDKRNFPYVDTLGNITIGIGYNLTARGLSDEWINQQFEKDVTYFYNCLRLDFDWFKRLNEDRQIVLIDMCFMGYKNFLSFKKMLSALSRDDYREAANEMLDSKWAKQTKGRAESLAHGMRTGVYSI